MRTASAVAAGELDAQRRARGRVGAHVREEVVDHLAEAVVVARDERGRELDLDGAIRLERPRGLHRLGDDLVEGDRLELERAALVEVGEQQEVVDEHAHPLGLAADPLHRALEVVGAVGGAAAEELGVGADRGERRAQLVRGVGDEPPELRLGGLERRHALLDLLEHLVEGEAEPADLGAGPRRARPAARGRRPRSPPPSCRSRRAGRRPRRTIQRASAVIASEDGGRDRELDQQQPVEGRVDVVERGGDRGGSGSAVRLDRGADAIAAAAGERRHGEEAHAVAVREPSTTSGA